jgi:hypothetical protein
MFLPRGKGDFLVNKKLLSFLVVALLVACVAMASAQEAKPLVTVSLL